MELFNKLGINWRLLIAQLVNFLILLAILYKFLYRPVLKFLDDRTKRIADSLHKADKIDLDFKEASAKREELLTHAKKEAAVILADAQARGEKTYKEKLAQTTAEAKQIVDKAKQAMLDEKTLAVKAAKSEIADMVVQATQKVLEQTVDKGLDEKLVSKILQSVK